jgi:F-type H+-transporting ATPase subunit delta
MNHPEVCDRYARALIELAEKASLLDQVENDLARVATLLSDQPGVARIINSPIVAVADKEKFIDRILQGNSRLLPDFLKVLICKKRFTDFDGIQKEYHRLFEKKKGLQDVKVITAVKISESNKIRLAAALKTKLRSEIRLLCETNPQILGGMVLRFDGREIDSSYKTYLAGIRQKLMA